MRRISEDPQQNSLISILIDDDYRLSSVIKLGDSRWRELEQDWTSTHCHCQQLVITIFKF